VKNYIIPIHNPLLGHHDPSNRKVWLCGEWQGGEQAAIGKEGSW